MPTYKISSDTLTQGRITRKICAEDYPDALRVMDMVVDEMDGLVFNPDTDMPTTATFDELLSGKYGETANYVERFGKWQILLVSGWFFTGDLTGEIGTLCDVMAKIDPVTMH